MSTPNKIRKILDDANIHYKYIEHEEAKTKKNSEVFHFFRKLFDSTGQIDTDYLNKIILLEIELRW